MQHSLSCLTTLTLTKPCLWRANCSGRSWHFLSLFSWTTAVEHSSVNRQRRVSATATLTSWEPRTIYCIHYTNDLPHLYSEILLLLWWARHSSSPPQEAEQANKANWNGKGGLGGRIWSLKLEHIQDSVVNTTIFAQNALGLQTTTYLYGCWNCLLPPLLFPQPVCCSSSTDIHSYSSPEPCGWFKAALG